MNRLDYTLIILSFAVIMIAISSMVHGSRIKSLKERIEVLELQVLDSNKSINE